MTIQNYRMLRADSPFIRHMFEAGSLPYVHWTGESNPFARMGGRSMATKDPNGSGKRAEWGDTPISLVSLQDTDTLTMYRDIKNRIAFQVNGRPGNKRTQSPKRVSLTVSSGEVQQDDGFEISKDWENVKLAVDDIVNFSNHLGQWAQAAQGEIILAAMSGVRGVEDNYEAFPEFLDAAGATFDTMASSDFMTLINKMQGEVSGLPDERKVRPLTTVFSTAALSSTPKPASGDGAINLNAFTGAATEELSYKDTLALRTYCNKSGNLGRQDFPFKRARLNAFNLDGENNKRISSNESLVLMTNHDVVNGLMEDEEWVRAMNSAATHDGQMTGLFTGRSAMLRGTEVVGFDKTPTIRNGATDISLSLLLGQGAFMLTQGMTKRKVEYKIWQNHTMRRFMETNLPVKVLCYSIDERDEMRAVSIHFRCGAIRTSFVGTNKKRHDIGVIGLLSKKPQFS